MCLTLFIFDCYADYPQNGSSAVHVLPNSVDNWDFTVFKKQ